MLPSPWGVVAVVAGGLVEIAETTFLWRLSHRRKPMVGVETLIGTTARVSTPCRPDGHVHVAGELWQARCDGGADAGAEVRVIAVEGLTLVVEAV